ncbi:MAG: ACP S-malonyltransferase [Chlamydiales bacterium]
MKEQQTAFIFPGQGAQYVGMAKDFFEQFAIAKQTFEEASDVLKKSLSDLIFCGSADELTKTKNSQVAIYVASIAVMRVLQEYFPIIPKVCAGLSLGEYTALTSANILEFHSGLRLVNMRATLMQKATIQSPGVMSAVIGLEESEVRQSILATELENAVWIANINDPKQIVISGTRDGVRILSEFLKQEKRKRVIPLNTSGAFHSELMRSAACGLQESLTNTQFFPSSISIAMNYTGKVPISLEEMRANLFNQLTGTVRWYDCIQSIEQLGVDQYIEIGPGKILTNINRRIGIKTPTVSVENVSDFNTLRSVCTSY